MEQALDAHVNGFVPRDELLALLQLHMAAADDKTVATFLAKVQNNQHLDADLVDDVTSTYTEDVQHWVFPEESGLSEAVPGAIECTFPELVQAVYGAGVVLQGLRSMLVGVNVRLNLRGTYRALGDALSLVTDELVVLGQACEYVGTNTPLAASFPGRGYDDRSPWYSLNGVPLSPRQIVLLAEINHEDSERSFTYAEGLLGHSASPQLVKVLVNKERKRQQSWEAEESGSEMQMGEARDYSCPRCGSEPGAACRSSSGNETTTHRGRYRHEL